MSSAARKKVDLQTMQMFDPEVDRPEHDQILVRLFQDDETLASILTGLHDATPLLPFSKESTFAMGHQYGQGGDKRIGLLEAIELTGVAPSWESESPIRIKHKAMEVLMNYPTDHAGKHHRLMGFIDFGVSYQLAVEPYLHYSEHERKYQWTSDPETFGALFEVKGAWPTSGNLIRQLNLYRSSNPVGIKGRVKHILVGPDDSMNDLANQHGYRLVTFDSKGESFKLLPAVSQKRETDASVGKF